MRGGVGQTRKSERDFFYGRALSYKADPSSCGAAPQGCGAVLRQSEYMNRRAQRSVNSIDDFHERGPDTSRKAQPGPTRATLT